MGTLYGISPYLCLFFFLFPSCSFSLSLPLSPVAKINETDTFGAGDDDEIQFDDIGDDDDDIDDVSVVGEVLLRQPHHHHLCSVRVSERGEQERFLMCLLIGIPHSISKPPDNELVYFSQDLIVIMATHQTVFFEERCWFYLRLTELFF